MTSLSLALLLILVVLLVTAGISVARKARRRPELPPPPPPAPPPLAEKTPTPIPTDEEVAPSPPVAPRVEAEPPPSFEPPTEEPTSIAEPGPELVAEPEPPRSRRAPPPWYPVVLAHGVLGFDALRVGFLQPQYFRGVAAQLRKAGNEVHVVRVSPVAGIAVRAAQLAAQIRAVPADRVNVIAHSMGGLDARYAITKLGLADRVASLTTVGTPHRGTPLANTGVWLVHEQLRLHRLLELLGVDAFCQLTTEHLEAFNEEVQDVPGIYYASCPARVSLGIRGVNSLLMPGYALLKREAGDNDGVVPTDSQRWGEELEEIEADHWAQVGWSLGFDAVRFYDQLVRALRRRRL